MANYYAYRIQLSQPSQLDAFFGMLPKRELLEIALANVRQQYYTLESKGKLYLVYYISSISDTIHLLQLARQDNVMEPKATPIGVTEQPDIIYPYSYFILDTQRQIILIQEKFSSFREIDTVVGRINDFFEKALSSHRVIAAIEAITDADDLWAEIEHAQAVYSVVFNFDPPNFFGTRFRSSIDVKEAYEETNFEKFKLILLNKLGGLRIRREEFQDILNSISSGAGSLVIKIRDQFGNIRQLGSGNRSKILELPDEASEISADQLDDKLNKLDGLNEGQNQKE